jgi:hypothetical protein
MLHPSPSPCFILPPLLQTPPLIHILRANIGDAPWARWI